MQASEEVGQGALPSSVDESVVTVQGALKFQQIGCDAAQKVISCLLSGATLPARIICMQELATSQKQLLNSSVA